MTTDGATTPPYEPSSRPRVSPDTLSIAYRTYRMVPRSSPPRLRLRLSPTAEQIVRSGHPWVYSDSLRELNRAGIAGELAVIYDRQDRFLALGFFDPDSPIRLRILHTGKPVTVNAEFWRQRLATTLARRAGLFGPDTDGYRCINGESDGWPGLVLDRYADTYVLKLYATPWLAPVAWARTATAGTPAPLDLSLISLIVEQLKPARLILRLSRNLQDAAAPLGLTDGQELLPPANPDAGQSAEPPAPSVHFHEDGLEFEAEVVRGQKTGFFLDQRENRRRIGELTAGAEVLNAFSFSGGFSLHAARGGARSVADLDISLVALQSAQRNFSFNQNHARVAAARHEQIQADAFEWLATGPRRTFDCVICDPPSLARRESERAGAIQAYGKLAATSLARVRPGGVLLAASCSAHVSTEEFLGVVRRAVRQSGRTAEEMATTGHAPDHPATFPEAQYLKGIYFRLRN